jgi:hypothetical protein
MADDISEKFKKIQAGLSSGKLASNDLALIYEKLESIKLMLSNMQLKSELEKASGKPSGETSGETSGKAALSLDEKIDRLRGVTTNITIDNIEKFLLHRPTQDFEYEGSSIGNEFKTSGDTEWFADVAEASSHIIATNPVVSVWVPKSNIKDVPHATSKEDSNWGELGTNPSQSRYKAIVGEGTYTVYQELKKSEDGINRYEITPEYTLTKKPWTEAGNYYGKPRDYWELSHNSNPGKFVGRFLVDTEHEPTMSHSKMEHGHKNKGLGSSVYSKLANHYGSLSSDTTKTSRSAKRVWEKIGGIMTGEVNRGNQNKQRYKIDGNVATDLKKSLNLNSLYVLEALSKSDLLQKDAGQIKPRHLEPKLTRPEQQVKQIDIGSGGAYEAPSTSEKIARHKATKAYGKYAEFPIQGKSDGFFLPSHLGHPQAFAAAGSADLNAHEGHHALADQLINKYGVDKISNMYDGMISKIHPQVRAMIGNILDTNPSYFNMKNHPDPRYRLARQEETVNLLRDFVHGSGKDSRREQFAHALKQPDWSRKIGFANPIHLDAAVKQSWKAVRDHANNLRPEDL